MRHSPVQRSFLGGIGRRIRLAGPQRGLRPAAQARHTGRPRHGSQLAPVLGPPPRHRLLRLAMVLGMTAAGFCLVLAMVGLVVALGHAGTATKAPAPARDGTQAASGRPAQPGPSARRPRSPDPSYRTSALYRQDRPGHREGRRRGQDTAKAAAHRFQVGATVASYQGNGSARHERFLVRGIGNWGISWNFSCAKPGTGSFGVSEADSKAADEIELTAYGPNGHGLSWNSHDPGDHSLVIVSNCSWVVRVVLPR
jgi:hypothetical protein